MPGPAVWTGGNSGGAQSPAQTPTEDTISPVPSSAPSSAPVASEAVAHNAENCNGGKAKRGRRAFREALLRKE
jgi:hypothetical protein